MTNQQLPAILTVSLKTILLFSILLSSSQLSGQSRSNKKVKTENHFTIQGSLFYDYGTTTIGTSTSGSISHDLAHVDFKKIGLGILRFEDKKASQILLEFSLYSNEVGAEFITTEIDPNPTLPARGFISKPLLIELEYFKSLLKKNKLANNLHIGYTFNFNVSRENFIPFATNQYQNTNTCICVGAGLKAMYIFTLSKKTLVTISTDLNLLDIGYGINYQADPNIFADLQRSTDSRVSLLRKRFGIDIGIAF